MLFCHTDKACTGRWYGDALESDRTSNGRRGCEGHSRWHDFGERWWCLNKTLGEIKPIFFSTQLALGPLATADVGLMAFGGLLIATLFHHKVCRFRVEAHLL